MNKMNFRPPFVHFNMEMEKSYPLYITKFNTEVEVTSGPIIMQPPVPPPLPPPIPPPLPPRDDQEESPPPSSEEETELESDEDVRPDEYVTAAPKRKLQKNLVIRKRPRVTDIIPIPKPISANPSGPVQPSQVFQTDNQSTVKSIEIHITPESVIQNNKTADSREENVENNHSDASIGGFGKLEPTKIDEVENEEENPDEFSWDTSKFISSKELRENQIPHRGNYLMNIDRCIQSNFFSY